MRKHRDIILATTEKGRNYLVSEPNYRTTKIFTENLLAKEIEKTQILVNKPVCLGLSILELSDILRYEFWHDYVKPKYDEKRKLYIKTDNIYKDIADDVETRFDTSKYELGRPLPIGRDKK